MSSRRIPAWTRFRHPRTCADAGMIATELRRTVDVPLPCDRRTPLELEQEGRDRSRAERRVGRAARRVHRLSAAGQRRAHRARRSIGKAAAADDEVVRVDGRAVPIGRLRALAAAAADRVTVLPGSLGADRTSRPLRAVGLGVLLADSAALVLVLAYLQNLDWTRPDPATLVTVLALALFGAAVQAVLAVHLGRRVAAWRHASGPDEADAAEFPPRPATVLLLTVLLGAISTLAAAGLYLRVHLEGASIGAGPLAAVLGLVLAASAVAAPWCLVADEAFGPGPDARFVRAAGRALARSDRRRRGRLWRARRLLDAATRRRDRAAQLVACTLHAAGRDHLRGHRVVLLARGLAGEVGPYSAADLQTGSVPVGLLPLLGPTDHACLRLPVDRLDAAVEAAEHAYRLMSATARIDVDLAG